MYLFQRPPIIPCLLKTLVLIDFGSAADLDPTGPFGFKKRVGLDDDSIVALSPIYAAPEQFVKVDRYVTWKGMEKNPLQLVILIQPLSHSFDYLNGVPRNPLRFDVFSAAMIFCQLLFNLLDERADAAFRQQLQESNYDLDTWLARELSTTIRPVGLVDALLYLDERRGM